MKVTEEQFRRAVDDPSYRQEFSRSVDLGEYAKYVKDVKYVDHPRFFYKNAIMAANPSLLSRFHLTGYKSKIKVYPVAFDSDVHANVSDFLGTLKHHEGYHAEDFYKTPSDSVIFGSNPLLLGVRGVFLLVRRAYAEKTGNSKMSQETREKLKSSLWRELRAYQNEQHKMDNRNSQIYRDHVEKHIDAIVYELAWN